jgi:protein TonB
MTSLNINPVKIPVAFLGAACITLLLFFLMQLLIKTDLVKPEFDPIKIGPITFPDPEIEVVRITLRPPLIEEAPEIERLPTTVIDAGEYSDDYIKIAPSLTLPTSEQPDFYLGEGSALVLRQVNPVYPGSALNRGIEGFVMVEFDINPIGAVVDPRVLYAEPERIFDRAALSAITKWRFKPKVEKGEEVFQYNERRLINFTIEE